MASADIQCAICHMQLPSDLVRAFTLPCAANLVLRLGGVGLDIDVVPEVLVMPMGWNWASRFCQGALCNIIARGAAVEESRFIVDGSSPT
eukprot:8527762-Pyramimonas_sp.AAC.1